MKNISEFTWKYQMMFAIFWYLVVGIVYGVTSQVWLYEGGKEVTFSLWISMPLTIIFWPLDVYADLKWIGVLPQDIAAISSLIFPLLWLLWTRISS